jgi:hypothetical protein
LVIFFLIFKLCELVFFYWGFSFPAVDPDDSGLNTRGHSREKASYAELVCFPCGNSFAVETSWVSRRRRGRNGVEKSAVEHWFAKES